MNALDSRINDSIPTTERPLPNPPFPQSPSPRPNSASNFRFLTESNGLNGFIFSLLAEIPSHSSFANLSPADHLKILQWLIRHKLTDVKNLLAKPKPEGCAIQTSIMSISRYKRRFLSDFLCELHQRDLQNATPNRSPNGEPRTEAALKTETLTALRLRLFNAAINPAADPFKIRSLACAFEKVSKHPTLSDEPNPPINATALADL